MARDILLFNRNAKTNVLNGPIHYTIAQSLTPPSITRKTRGKQCNAPPDVITVISKEALLETTEEKQFISWI